MKKSIVFSLFLIVWGLMTTLGPEIGAQGKSELTLSYLGIRPHVPQELLVQFLPQASTSDQEMALKRIGAQWQSRVVRRERRGDRKGDLDRVTLPGGIGIAEAVRLIETDPVVEFAEPNWIYQHQAISNDPYYTNGSLWGMYGDQTTPTNPYGSQAGEAWAADKTNASNVWVGIIDEGYMYTHEDLAANAGKNPGEIAGNGLDDDGNGYIDDVYGWDFVANDNSIFDGLLDDHGTHVAGTIGAVGGNGKGVVGMCWSVKLMSGKFLGRTSGTTENAIKAVDYFTDLKQRHGLNLVATNNSWGGGGYSQALADAIERANAANILFVVAAGNETNDNDLTPSYPASYSSENVIAVASITNTGTLSSFSNWGATSVDLGAPGSGIYSTLPVKSGRLVVSGYGSYSGTSMATPHVTGACALYLAYHPGASAQEVKNAILGSVIPTASLNGKTLTGGRLNVGEF